MQRTDESGGHILLVEDDNAVRAFIAASLKAAGYRFYQAASGEEALQLFEQHSDDIDLLLTDVVMPGMFGDQLAMRIIELKPSIKIILMSGNTPQALETEIQLEPGVNFLQKPFLLQDLRECLAQHLVPSIHD
jgi:CheY-like chemotaxis protein